jgi:hypothetical protein
MRFVIPQMKQELQTYKNTLATKKAPNMRVKWEWIKSEFNFKDINFLEKKIFHQQVCI